MVRVNEQDDVAFSDLLAQRRSILGTRRGVDDDSSNVFGGAYAGRDSDLRKDGLYLVGDELVFDECCDQTGFARRLIAADTDSDCDATLEGVRNRGWVRERGPYRSS